MLRPTILAIVLLGCCHQAMAQQESLRPSFEVEYTGELQTDFKRSHLANLLQLRAEVPLSKALSFQVHSVSIASSDEEPLADDLMGYSNIDVEDIPFALSVAGLMWHINDRHSLFVGIRRTDEDYFCSHAIGLFTNSPCGIFPTISNNHDIATYPKASMGIHYAYDTESLCLQASLYNGLGYHRFTGRENVFRICPKSDGVFGLAQAEYRYHDSHYFLGASTYYSNLKATADHRLHPSVWFYAEQSLSSAFTLLVACGHAFNSDHPCRNFCGLGGNYAFKRAEFGLLTEYTRIDGIDEWATELTCKLALSDHLSLQPVVHILTTDSKTKCIGMMRLNICL